MERADHNHWPLPHPASDDARHSFNGFCVLHGRAAKLHDQHVLNLPNLGFTSRTKNKNPTASLPVGLGCSRWLYLNLIHLPHRVSYERSL
jgi:hypothetical protein